MPDNIRAISAISGLSQSRESVTAHMIRLLNDGGLQHYYQPKKTANRIKGAGERRDEFGQADSEIHHIDILA